MNLNNRVKNRFEISEILKKLLLKVSKLEKNTAHPKTFCAIITQNGTSNPQFSKILVNEFAAIPVLVRTDIGQYRLISSELTQGNVVVNGKYLFSNTIFSSADYTTPDISVSGGPFNGRIICPDDFPSTIQNYFSFRTYDNVNVSTDSVLNSLPFFIKIEIY